MSAHSRVMDTMEGSIDEGLPYINSTVGTLVWVRRRNGSWWPGRILAPEELPGAHLLSPRTGTPVKLLGRDDGSVDWYNIEKSRRVKAFRCGEFDECIEKARSLASVLSKKREKYARREDAILHALELEKELMQQTHLKAKMFSMGLNHEQLFDFANGGKLFHSAVNSQRSLIGLATSLDVADASSDALFNLHGHRKLLDVEWEEEFTDSLSHMRGLQDLGLGTDPPKGEKASWSSVDELFPHASVTEEKKKAARCVNRSIVDGMAPKRIRMLKKKRVAQSNLMEDESTYKKQKTIPGPSDINGNFVDSASELGSKLCCSPFTVNADRNGYASLSRYKEENIADLLDKVPFHYKSLKGWSGLESWEASLMESRCRNEMLSFLPFMDKSFADHQKPSCSARPYLYRGSQMEVPSFEGPAFVDSLLQGGPVSRCSFSPGATYAGSIVSEPSTEVERADSLSSTPPVNFQPWPCYNHTEFIPEKVMHESGSRRQSASVNPTYCLEYPFETSMPSNASVPYTACSNNNMIFDKGRPHDAEGPFTAGSDLNVNTITFSRHCLSPVAEEDATEGSFSGEDEADSSQQIPGSSLSSPEAVVTCAVDGHLKEEPLFEDTSYCSKVPVDIALGNRILVDEGWGEDSGICAAVEKGSLPEESDEMVFEQFLSKWQGKGRRLARARCRTVWGFLADKRLEENIEVQMAPYAVKSVGKRSRRPRRAFGSASCEEESLPAQVSSKVGTDHATEAKVCKVSQVTMTYWFDVPIEFQIATFQPLVSIMSELIGKPIVGYSVPVEKIADRLKEGPTDGEGNVMNRNSTAQPSRQPVWKTARRTAMQRIPRPCSIVASLNHTCELVGKHRQGILCGGENRGMRENELQSGSSSVERMHQKKLALLPQKTRTLSSITVQNSDKSLEPAGVKDSDAPLVTCISVNVIFNRIREVLYRK